MSGKDKIYKAAPFSWLYSAILGLAAGSVVVNSSVVAGQDLKQGARFVLWIYAAR